MSPPEPLPAGEAPISPGAALAGTFTRPGATFERLVRRPTWWLPLLISLLIGAAAAFVATPKLDFDRSTREAFEKRAEKTGQSVPDAQVERAVAISKKIASFSWAFALTVGGALFFIVGLILWGGAQAFGGETRYGQVLAVWAHGQLPNAVAQILAIPVFLTRPDASLTQPEAATVFQSNVGAFLPLDANAALRAFASSLDVFSFATLALLVIGFRRLPGLSKGTGAAVPLVAWGVWVVAKTLWMAVFG